MSKSSLPLRKLIKRLKGHEIVVMSRKRGKGSEIILLKPNKKGSKKGLQYPIKNHGDSTEISIPVINALLRRFNIDKGDFWS
jgi:hypothetical protein